MCFTAGENPESLAVELNYRASQGYKLETLRRIREEPFKLLVIMKRKGEG